MMSAIWFWFRLALNLAIGIWMMTLAFDGAMPTMYRLLAGALSVATLVETIRVVRRYIILTKLIKRLELEEKMEEWREKQEEASARRRRGQGPSRSNLQ